MRIWSFAWVIKEYRPWTPEQTFLLPPSPLLTAHDDGAAALRLLRRCLLFAQSGASHLRKLGLPRARRLVPMLERVREYCGPLPQQLTADTGYLSERNITYCEAHGVDVYIAVRRNEDDSAQLGRFPMSTAQEIRWRMHQK